MCFFLVFKLFFKGFYLHNAINVIIVLFVVPDAPTLVAVSAGFVLAVGLKDLANFCPVGVLGLRLPLSAAVALTLFVAVQARYLARLLVSRVRKAGLLRDAAALAAATCFSLTTRDALVLIEQIAIGLNLVRGAIEEPGEARQIALERCSVDKVVLRQNGTH